MVVDYDSQPMERDNMKIKRAMFTWAIPGYWYELENGEKEFSAYGEELTEKQRNTVMGFPCNVFKAV